MRRLGPVDARRYAFPERTERPLIMSLREFRNIKEPRTRHEGIPLCMTMIDAAQVHENIDGAATVRLVERRGPFTFG